MSYLIGPRRGLHARPGPLLWQRVAGRLGATPADLKAITRTLPATLKFDGMSHFFTEVVGGRVGHADYFGLVSAMSNPVRVWPVIAGSQQSALYHLAASLVSVDGVVAFANASASAPQQEKPAEEKPVEELPAEENFMAIPLPLPPSMPDMPGELAEPNVVREQPAPEPVVYAKETTVEVPRPRILLPPPATEPQPPVAPEVSQPPEPQPPVRRRGRHSAPDLEEAPVENPVRPPENIVVPVVDAEPSAAQPQVPAAVAYASQPEVSEPVAYVTEPQVPEPVAYADEVEAYAGNVETEPVDDDVVEAEPVTEQVADDDPAVIATFAHDQVTERDAVISKLVDAIGKRDDLIEHREQMITMLVERDRLIERLFARLDERDAVINRLADAVTKRDEAIDHRDRMVGMLVEKVERLERTVGGQPEPPAEPPQQQEEAPAEAAGAEPFPARSVRPAIGARPSPALSYRSRLPGENGAADRTPRPVAPTRRRPNPDQPPGRLLTGDRTDFPTRNRMT